MDKRKNYDFGWEPSEVFPIQVKVDSGRFEDAIGRFKRLFQKEKVVAILKEKRAHEKPSVKKRRKQREAASRRMMAEARERMIKNGEWDRRQRQKQAKRARKNEDKIRKRINSGTELENEQQ